MRRKAIGLLTGIVALSAFVGMARADDEEHMPGTPGDQQDQTHVEPRHSARSGISSPWCRQLADSSDPMLKSEGYGVSSCNDRARTPYQPWSSTVPRYKDPSNPMNSDTDWGGRGYDYRYDDHYDRRSHKYR